MTSKEGKEAIGALVERAVTSAAREAAGDKVPGHSKALNELLDEVTATQQRLALRIYRRGFGVNSGQEEYITTLYNMDPEMIREGGIEPMIQQYCGGGSYRVMVSAPGVQTRSLTANIAGEPINVKPENSLKALASGFPALPGQPQPMIGPLGLGYNFGQVQGFGSNQNQSQTSHLSEAMVLANFLTQQKQPAGDSDELKVMRAQIEELKLQKTAAEAERARVESERRADLQIAELKSQMERISSAPKADTTDKLLALVTALGPVVGAVMQSREQSQAAIAAAQATAQQNQMNMILAMLGGQKDASAQSMEMFRTMLLQPKESETDKMRGIMDIATSSMSTTMGLTQAMINQMQAMQPGERPPWMEVIMTLIQNASEMGQAFLESRSQRLAGADEEEPSRQIGPAQVMKPLPGAAAAAAAASDPRVIDIQSAASAAAAAAQETLGAPGEEPVSEPELDDNGEPLPNIPLPDYTSGAFKLIFEKITERDGNDHFVGDLHEAAFRIWKHASSGDKIALIWVQNPVAYTLDALDVLAQNGDILITAERIEETAQVMLDMFNHFRSGQGALEYVQKHGLSISLPKRVVVVPLPPRQEGEVDDVGTVEEMQAEPPAPTPLRPVPVPPAESEASPPREAIPPAEPSAPTPSFGGSPPVPRAEPSAPTPSFGGSPEPSVPPLE